MLPGAKTVGERVKISPVTRVNQYLHHKQWSPSVSCTECEHVTCMDDDHASASYFIHIYSALIYVYRVAIYCKIVKPGCLYQSPKSP